MAEEKLTRHGTYGNISPAAYIKENIGNVILHERCFFICVSECARRSLASDGFLVRYGKVFHAAASLRLQWSCHFLLLDFGPLWKWIEFGYHHPLKISSLMIGAIVFTVMSGTEKPLVQRLSISVTNNKNLLPRRERGYSRPEVQCALDWDVMAWHHHRALMAWRLWRLHILDTCKCGDAAC